MNGRTKSFIEDTIITVVIVIIIGILYYIISNFILDNKKIEKNTSIMNLIQKEMSELKNTLKAKAKDINRTQKNTLKAKDTNKTQKNILKAIEIKDEDLNSTKIQKPNEKHIDIKKLKEFIKNIENNISQQIVYKKDQNSTQPKYIKIRFTLLKSGDYEQLTFVDGDKKVFEKNKANIEKVFPVSINKDIIEEFPRYIRVEIRKKF